MARLLPPPPIKEDLPTPFRDWLNKLYTFLGDTTNLILWNQIDTSGSELDDITTRPHAQLQAVSGSSEQVHVSATERTNLQELAAGADTSLHFHVHNHTTADPEGPLTNDEHDGYMEITTSSAPSTPASGKMRIYAQDASGVARLRAVHSSGSDLAFFRDSVVRVKNTSGVTINKGEVAYITGATGNAPTIAKARANAASTMPASGMVLATAADNAFTTLQFTGEITGLDTAAFSEGDRVYVSSATAGAITATEPLYPNLSQQIGTVTKANAGDGRIQLFVSLQHEGDDSGSNRNTFSIGDGAAGAKVLAFVNTNTGNLSWTPTASRTLTLPDETGTLLTETFPSTVTLKSFTVAGLPAAGTLGRIACVSDALAPSFLVTVVGGGAVKAPVFDNGTAWVSF